MTIKGIANGLPTSHRRLFARDHTTDMEIRHERRILKRLAFWLAVCVLALVLSGQALADLPPPTPPAAIHTIANAPHQMPLSGTFSNGRFSYSIPPSGGDSASVAARARHYQNALHGTNPDLLSGMKSHPIRLTDNYGNAATGQIRTATTMPASNTLANIGGALIIGQISGNAVQRADSAGLGQALHDGRYGEATRIAGASVADAVYGGAFTALREIIDTAIHGKVDVYREAVQSMPDVNSALAAGNAYYMKASAIDYNTRQHVITSYAFVPTLTGLGIADYIDHSNSGGRFKQHGGVDAVINGKVYQSIRWSLPPGLYMIYDKNADKLTPDFYASHKDKFVNPDRPQFDWPTDADYAAAMLAQLQDLNRNHTDLINWLYANGGINPNNTQTTVLGTPAENTFVTPPFTPVGSDQAQQTQFVVNADGSVTVSQIQRPDLAAHTSQAPTRAEVGQQAPSPAETRDAKQGSTAEKPDICAQNPNSLMCADLGSGDYTDPVLPNEQRSLDFNPADLFADTGTCPAPKQISVFKVNIKLPYDPLCDMAGKLRPLIILLGMSIAMFMVYGAVNNE